MTLATNIIAASPLVAAENALGSIALAILKRLEVPMLVVTPKAAKAVDLLYGNHQLRLLLMVEGYSMPLLEYACERVLVGRRGDKLTLGQVRSLSRRRRRVDFISLFLLIILIV